MRSFFVVLLVLLLITPFTVSAYTVPEQFLGKWKAYSRVIQAIYGDLEVKKNSLSFKKLGSHTFIVIATNDDSVVLEMSKSFKDDCGCYIRLGLILKENSDSSDSLYIGYLTFTVHKNKEEALAPKNIHPITNKLEYPYNCVWGFYSP